MEDASNYVWFLLRIEKRDKKAMNSAFLTDSLKDLKLMTKISKFQFPYPWKEKQTSSLWLK